MHDPPAIFSGLLDLRGFPFLETQTLPFNHCFIQFIQFFRLPLADLFNLQPPPPPPPLPGDNGHIYYPYGGGGGRRGDPALKKHSDPGSPVGNYPALPGTFGTFGRGGGGGGGGTPKTSQRKVSDPVTMAMAGRFRAQGGGVGISYQGNRGATAQGIQRAR